MLKTVRFFPNITLTSRKNPINPKELSKACADSKKETTHEISNCFVQSGPTWQKG
jgi:hypothetical protein